MMAAANGHSSIVKLLLNKHVDIHHMSYAGENALHLAVTQGDIATIKLLVDAIDVKNIDTRDHLQRTALYLAADAGDPDVILVLLNARSDFSIRNLDGDIPIQLSARRGHISSVMLLLEQERDSDRQHSFYCCSHSNLPL
jgi:ankyrin repeat protein